MQPGLVFPPELAVEIDADPTSGSGSEHPARPPRQLPAEVGDFATGLPYRVLLEPILGSSLFCPGMVNGLQGDSLGIIFIVQLLKITEVEKGFRLL
jgi:hypothetical protein